MVKNGQMTAIFERVWRYLQVLTNENGNFSVVVNVILGLVSIYSDS